MKKLLIIIAGVALVSGMVLSLVSMKKNKETKVQEETMAEEVNAFGFRVFRAVRSDDNVFLSPLSLSMALSMLSGGAEGRTEEAMMKTLGLTGWSKEETGAYFRRMAETLKAADPKTTFEIANSVWVHQDTELMKEYVRWADNYYGSTVSEEDFDDPGTLKKVNDWCAKKTHEKITSILDQLNAETKMLLLNALYFKGEWEDTFDRARSGKFRTLDGSMAETDMMEDTRWCDYYENETLQAVSLPYGSGRYSAVLVLPKAETAFGKFADGFDGKAWNEIVGGLEEERVYLRLPKFKMEYEVNLNQTLKDLGMNVAFTNSADFSSLAKKALKVGLVKQKTYVDFNESGTEAAAVTAIAMLETTALPIEPKPFIADRPFLIAIRESGTGSILFLGQKTN